MASRVKGMVPLLAVVALAGLASMVTGDECNLTPVFHVLQYPGCIPKPIPSFACMGKCTSYVQVCKRKQNHSNWQVKGNCFIYSLPPALPGLAKCCINNVIMLESSQEEMYALKYNNGIRNINSPVNIKVELCLGS